MKTHTEKILLSDGIVFLLLSFSVITAINFYYKALFTRNEINDIVADDVLSEELYAQLFPV